MKRKILTTVYSKGRLVMLNRSKTEQEQFVYSDNNKLKGLFNGFEAKLAAIQMKGGTP